MSITYHTPGFVEFATALGQLTPQQQAEWHKWLAENTVPLEDYEDLQRELEAANEALEAEENTTTQLECKLDDIGLLIDKLMECVDLEADERIIDPNFINEAKDAIGGLEKYRYAGV